MVAAAEAVMAVEEEMVAAAIDQPGGPRSLVKLSRGVRASPVDNPRR